MRGIFGTQTWMVSNPFKADGRDILPALRWYREYLPALRMSNWKMFWQLVLVAAFTILTVGTFWGWIVIA